MSHQLDTTTTLESDETRKQEPAENAPQAVAEQESTDSATPEALSDAAADATAESPPLAAGEAEDVSPASDEPMAASAADPTGATEEAAAAVAETEATEASPPMESAADATATDEPPMPEGATAASAAEMAALEQAMTEKTPVEGKVIGWNKGGYHVAIGKIAAFCPVSQMEIGSPRSPKRYLDKTFDFHVIEIQKGGRRVVVSRATALQAQREARAKEVRERLSPGAVLTGKVSSLTTFGAFVDLGGGIEGLVHISEISRRRVEHPKDLLKVGQKVEVSILKIEKGGERVSLSMKRLEEDPWTEVGERFKAGAEFEGKILRKTDFGLFVEVEPGLEGLVHVSRLPLGVDLSSESLEIGQTVKGWIHEVEPRRRRLSLSLREMADGNPWKGISDRYPVGTLVQGKVERVATFGAFIQLEPGLTGLLPFSTLGAGPGNPKRQFQVGRDVSVRVLSIDRDKKRISLGTEASKAEGTTADYRDYLKNQNQGAGLNALAAAFEKLRGGAESTNG